MEEVKYKEGDMVRLKTGGPSMTANRIYLGPDQKYLVNCCYFRQFIDPEVRVVVDNVIHPKLQYTDLIWVEGLHLDTLEKVETNEQVA